MSRITKRYGPWAIVTGASSGIGEAVAHRLAKEGLNLVLVARRGERLLWVSHELRAATGVEVRTLTADLSQPGSIHAVEQVTRDIEVGLVVNSAGGTMFGDFVDGSIDEELGRLNLNVAAPMALAHRYGRAMRERGRGGIVFVSSIVAAAGVPGWSTYAAAKAANLVFAEGLASELAKDGVDVLAVSPGPTQTEFMALSRIGKSIAMTADQVAKGVLRKLGRRRSWTPGLLNKAIFFSTRLLPRALNAYIFGRVIGVIRDGEKTVVTQSVKESPETWWAAL